MIRQIKWIFAVTALTLILSGSSANAQGAAEDPNEPQWVQIRAIKSVYEEAIKSGDLQKLEPFIAKHFTAAMVTGEEVSGFEQFKSYDRKIRAQIGAGGSYSAQIKYQPGALYGDIALAHGDTVEKVVTSEGNVFDFTSLWTTVLVKEEGQWKLLRIHVSMDPVENAFVKVFRQRSNQLYGGVALLIGILFGFLLRGVLAKKQR